MFPYIVCHLASTVIHPGNFLLLSLVLITFLVACFQFILGLPFCNDISLAIPIPIWVILSSSICYRCLYQVNCSLSICALNAHHTFNLSFLILSLFDILKVLVAFISTCAVSFSLFQHHIATPLFVIDLNTYNFQILLYFHPRAFHLGRQ